MYKTKKSLAAQGLLLLVATITFAASAFAQDNNQPDVTARVARISVLKGDAQIRRQGTSEWENATVNLPLAEGDEILAENKARIEVQLDSKNYLRIGENSRVIMTTLRDEGVAVSLVSGDALLRIGAFDENKNFFEVDAPNTTVAVKAAGSYLINSGNGTSDDVRLSVGDGGEARIYSDQSGFTVRNGRGAVLYLVGNRAGEWETLAADFSDSLSKWSEDRDDSIAKKLKNAYFGKYYDYDQYGAEDLSDYGDWINTPQYGYVWRPYNNVTSYYRDWSPYRYGHWRWFPPYGWTWVNDEPWGWATYHHGRWIYLSGGWYWSPYASYRWSRSWWQPAFVTIATYGGRVYWYPIGYYTPYYNFNWGYHGGHRDGGRGGRGDRDDNRGSGNTYPFPTGGDRFKQKPIDRVPPSGVVAVDDNDFGRTRGGGRTAPPDVANNILNGEKGREYWNEISDTVPGGRRGGGDITVDNSRVRQLGPPLRTGASYRNSGTSLDSQLEKQVIFQDRTPARKPPVRINGDPVEQEGTRGSGAVDRSTTPPVGGRFEQKPIDRNNNNNNNGGGRVSPPSENSQPNGRFTQKPVDRSGGGSTTYTPPKKEDPPSTPVRKYEPPVRSNPPERKYEPPVRNTPPAPKYEPPVRSNPPERKYEPPVRNTPPPPRNDPPKSSPPPKSNPPSRSEPPKSDSSPLQRKAPPKIPDEE